MASVCRYVVLTRKVDQPTAEYDGMTESLLSARQAAEVFVKSQSEGATAWVCEVKEKLTGSITVKTERA